MHWTTFCSLHRFSASIIKHNLTELAFFFADCITAGSSHSPPPDMATFRFSPPVSLGSYQLFCENKMFLHKYSSKEKERKKEYLPFIATSWQHFSPLWMKDLRQCGALKSCSESWDAPWKRTCSSVLWLFLVTWFSLGFPFWHLHLAVTSIAHEKESICKSIDSATRRVIGSMGIGVRRNRWFLACCRYPM